MRAGVSQAKRVPVVIWAGLSVLAALIMAVAGPRAVGPDATSDLAFLEYTLILAAMVAAAVVDARRRVIPNVVPVGVVLIHLVFVLASPLAGAPDALPAVFASFAGALAFGAALLGITLAFEAWAGHEAFGGGDIKLVAAFAFAAGCPCAFSALAVACGVFILNAVVLGLCDRLHARPPGKTRPFAPALAIGVLLAFLA